MSNIFQLISGITDNPKKNLIDFVQYCHDSLKLYEDQGGFGVNQWTYTDKHGRKHSMRFAEYAQKSDTYNFTPFKEPYLSFAKAYVRFHQEQQEVTSVGNKTSALAAVYDALRILGRRPDILALDGAVFARSSDLIRERNSDGRRYQIGNELEMLGDFVRNKAICPTLPFWKNPYPRQRYRAQGTSVEDKVWQEERCPSLHQMLSLADIFRVAEKEEDRYWSSIMVLLMFAPGRGSEPGSLMIDSLIEEDGRWKVIWYPRKNSEWTKKIVPVVLEPAVKEAFARLIEIGGPAREAAKYAFENPGKFMRHSSCITALDCGEDEPLNALEFACATCLNETVIEKLKNRQVQGYSLNDAAAWAIVGASQTKWLSAMRKNGPVTYRRLAERTITEYRTHGWPNKPGSKRPIWDSLILVQDRQFHASFEAKSFSWLIPSINTLNIELGGKDYESKAGVNLRLTSIFERFGKVDEDGTTPISLTSHQFRVWLSTWAERGGMNAWQLAQWAGRARIEDKEAYNLMLQHEKQDALKAVLMLKQAPTALDAVRLNLPVTYKSLGIDRPGVAHATLYGYCVRDWAMAPCLKGGGKACATCDDHKCIKGLEDKLENLEALESGMSRELSRAALELDASTFGANNWYRFLGFRLAKVRTIIAQMKNPEIPVGTILGVPPEFDPSPLQRARSFVLPATSEADQQAVQRDLKVQLLS